MSGTLSQHRPGSKPLIIDGIPVLKFDKYGKPVMRHVLRPGGTYVDGRCVDYQVLTYVATRHVLVYNEAADRPSKHAKGRIRPRNASERQHAASLQRRITQASKSFTLDVQAMALHLGR